MKVFKFPLLVGMVACMEIVLCATVISLQHNDSLGVSIAVSQILNHQLALEKSMCSLYIFIKDMDGRDITDEIVHKIEPSLRVHMFYAKENSIDHSWLAKLVGDASQVRRESWCVFVVGISDDPIFLTTVAKTSLKLELVAGSTKFFAFTRLAVHHLQALHEPLSIINAIMVIVDGSKHVRCTMYVFLPYTERNVQPLLVATWQNQKGLVHANRLPLFPDKFYRFLWRPTLIVAEDEYRPHATVTEEKRPDGKTATLYKGPMLNVLNILASNINFSYTMVRPPDGAWGAKLSDGSWTGMVAMVKNEEVDIALGPFGMTAVRAEVVDYTHPMILDYARILGRKGNPEVDPWGFILPLSTNVWVVLMVTLLLVIFTILLISACNSHHLRSSSENVIDILRVLLCQDILGGVRNNWEHIIIGSWMLLILVVTKSFSGNLMSLLAVKHIPQPFQSIRDVLDDASVTMIWERNSAYVQHFRNAKFGIYQEIAESEEKGRIFYQRSSLFLQSFNTQVRSGTHVLIAENLLHQEFMANDFSDKGRCDFYVSREQILPLMFAMVGRKGSLLVPSISERIKSLTESGLYSYWLKSAVPNSTSCTFASRKLTENSSLSIENIWGPFVVLAGGGFLAFWGLLVEITLHNLCDYA